MELKRLVFRHYDGIFKNKSEAEKYFGLVVNPESVKSLNFGGAKYGEPLVAQYYEKDGETISAILGIGTEQGYVLIDGSDIKAQLASLTERMGIAEEDIDNLEKQLADEIARAENAENAIHTELDGAIAGAGLEEHTGNYLPNVGTPTYPIVYIKEASSLKDADEKLDTALQALDKEVVKHVTVNPNDAKHSLNAEIVDNTAQFTLTTDNILIDEDIKCPDDNQYEIVEVHHSDTVSDIIEATNEVLAKKVDHKDGMSFMSDAEHEKLSGITEGANVNVIDNVYERDKVLKLETDAEGEHTLKSELSLEYDGKYIYLKGIDGVEIAKIPVDDFLIDGMIKDAEIRVINGKKTLTLFLNTDGGDKEINVDVEDFFNIYTVADDSVDYLKIDGYKISVKVDGNGLATLKALDNAVTNLNEADNTLDKKIDGEIENRKDEITRLEQKVDDNAEDINTLNGGADYPGSVKHTILTDTMIAKPVVITSDKAQGDTLLRLTSDNKIYASNRTSDIYDVDADAHLDTSLNKIRESIDTIIENQENDYNELMEAIGAEATARTVADNAIIKAYTESDAKLEISVKDAEKRANKYADSLADNYDEAGAADAAEKNAKNYADDIVESARTDASEALDKAIKAEADARIEAHNAQAEDIVSAVTYAEALVASARTDASEALDQAIKAEEEARDAATASALTEAKNYADAAITALTESLEEKTEFVGITSMDIKIEEGPLAGLLDGIYENNVIPSGTTYDSILEKLLVSDERKIYCWCGNIESKKYPTDDQYTAFTIGNAEDVKFSLPANSNTIIVAVPNGRTLLDIYLGAKDDEDVMFVGDYAKFEKRKLLDYKKRYNFYRFTFEENGDDINNIIVAFE